MCYSFADGEIQGIFEKKRDYNQDEDYFTWLEKVPQKRWKEYESVCLALKGETKDADVGLRTLFTKETDLESKMRLKGAIASNLVINEESSDRILTRFNEAIELFPEDCRGISDAHALNLVNLSDYRLGHHIVTNPEDKASNKVVADTLKNTLSYLEMDSNNQEPECVFTDALRSQWRQNLLQR